MALEQVSTFVLPNEYQRQATEARRRRRMAEMLAQQAYQPSDISAPIPTAAPLVQGLQAFLAARAERKADEAEESAKETASREARQYLKALTEEPDTTTDAVQPETKAAPTITMPQFEGGRLTSPAGIEMGAPAPMVAPQIQLSRYNLTPGQRRAAALEGMLASENPMVQKIAGAIYPTLQPEKPKLQLGNIDPAKFTPASIADAMNSGDISKLQLIAPEGAAPTELNKLINERNALIAKNPNDPMIKIYDAKIRNFVSGSGLSPKDIADLNLGLLNAGLKRLEINQSLPPDQAGNLPVVPATINDLLRYGGARQSGGNVRAGQTYLVGEQGPELVKFNQSGTVVPNPATKAPSSRSVIERTSPKERMKLEQQQPTDKKSVVNALSQVSMMRNLVRDLRRHGGVDYIFGPVMSRLPNVRGAATSAQSLYDTLLERTSVEAMKQNRQEGFAPGSITQQEWPRFESTIAPLKQTKEPAAMRRALENADAQLQNMEQRIIDNYEQTYGQQFPLDYAPPSYKFESELYPNEQAKKEKQAIYNRADAILRQMQQRR